MKPGTSFERARAGYDLEFRKHLADEIINAIANASMLSDANVMALRTSETLDALARARRDFRAGAGYGRAVRAAQGSRGLGQARAP